MAFEVPNALVTTTKTFRTAINGRPEPYAIAIGATRVIRVSPYASHAEFQVRTLLENQRALCYLNMGILWSRDVFWCILEWMTLDPRV